MINGRNIQTERCDAVLALVAINVIGARKVITEQAILRFTIGRGTE